MASMKLGSVYYEALITSRQESSVRSITDELIRRGNLNYELVSRGKSSNPCKVNLFGILVLNHKVQLKSKEYLVILKDH